MAIFHRATIKPTKEELIAAWAPKQRWGPSPGEPIDVIGSYRFDDPDGRVGMETFICMTATGPLQIPLTYREEALETPGALITEMTHSVLGTRWVYDGLQDPLYVVMLAGVTMTGQGEALGMVVYDSRWFIAPSKVRIRGGGWPGERVPVDRFELASDDASSSTLRNDRFELIFYRRPQPDPPSAIQLTATWPGRDRPVLLAQVNEL
jgi:hypothetical protein